MKYRIILLLLAFSLDYSGYHYLSTAEEAASAKGHLNAIQDETLHEACHEHYAVEENWDPNGNPGMEPCATTDEELEDYYKEGMEPDLQYWRQRVPLNRTRIDKFLERWSWYGWHQQSMILIYKGKWYYPFHWHWNHTQQSNDKSEDGITLWVGASQYYFDKMKHEIEFPDVFFFQSDQDGGWCDNIDWGSCPIPALSIAKDVHDKRVDLLYPFMVGVEHPLYNYPYPLKHNKAFFTGRANWGGSPKFFDVAGNGTLERFWSREYISRLSLNHSDKVWAPLIADPAINPGLRYANGETHMRDHARWKFLMHLDGVTYAFRLGRMMHANSVILKEETHWFEYYVRGLKEGVHYLPILRKGPDDVLEIFDQWQNRSLDLQRMAWNSQQYALKYLCPKARMLYFRRLLQEYKALFNENGRNHMQEFIEEVLVPIIKAREAGDMEKTYMNIKPYKPGRRRRSLRKRREG